MDYIDPHIHMVSRTTDDYETLARMGCVAMSEPAFWAGFDRGSVESFRDYFRQLTEFEPKRAAQFGIQHYTWLCINAKEAENVSLSREVIAMIPEFLNQSNVLGIGEIGLNKNTKNESTIFLEHVDLAVRYNQQILIHTPHLEDKFQGTKMIVDMLVHDSRVDRSRVLVDHVEEHTIQEVL
ncbi:MAG: TatD family hydrolase, partial [Planctomycetota bacterium]